MKKLTAAIVTTLFALSIGCGDNSNTGDVSERDTVIDVVPQAGDAITAIESAESLGFTEAIYFMELDIISMVGDPGLLDELEKMPGISSATVGVPLLPDLGAELALEFDVGTSGGGDTPTGPGNGKGKGKGKNK